MAEVQDSHPDLPIGGLREITLRIPGECFFCETISLPASVAKEAEGKNKLFENKVEELILEKLQDLSFSPYPPDQLAWGFHACKMGARAIFFATPLARLKQLGWENLDLFRRVFPSFVSLFSHPREKSQMEFLLHEDTLTLACFSKGSSVPNELFSLPVRWDKEDALEVVKSKLLSLVDVANYTPANSVVIATEVNRLPEGIFEFDHAPFEEESRSMAPPDKIRISADELWNHDLRHINFKKTEKKKRAQSRNRWKSMGFAVAATLVLLVCFVGLKIGGFKLKENEELSLEMGRQVPLVLESQKLLEKLKQNKLGGIDPFGALGRVAVHRGGPPDNPDLWFSLAHFETRSHVRLEGEGKNVESINTFLEKLERANVSSIRKGRSGEELRKIKSGGGKTTFEVEIDLFEEKPQKVAPSDARSSLPTERVKES